MNQPNPAPPRALTPAKLAVIILLAITLAGVAVLQFSGPQDQPVPLKRRIPVTSSSQPGTTSGADGTAAPNPERRNKWPEIPRDEVMAFNPFRVSESLANLIAPPAPAEPANSPHLHGSSPSHLSASAESSVPKSAASDNTDQARIRAQERQRRIKEQQATAAALQARGIAVLMRTTTGAVAKVGDLELRVGDVVNGLRVAEIGPEGILLVADHQDP